MYLKSLVLKGFKSFADRSVISLEPGVTAVVGPNGSGKSNITDAVLWVLGEQSAKQLRGTAMEDVIFAGSSARNAVGVAEVDLVLDNSDGTLPIEFEEVVISRRMYRSGESEYLINNSPSRLMDILDLLHDSGLGRDTQSIISQGRLETILQSRPEERRALIEEAAGVLKHKKRKERSMRKLAAMDAHLARAKDVAVEVDRQLRPLQRAADRAQEHAGLSTELRDLELALAVDDLRDLRDAYNKVLLKRKEAEAEVELARHHHSTVTEELEKFQKLLEEKGLFVGDLSEQRRRMQSATERIDAGLLLLEEKGKNLVGRMSDLRAKLYQAESRLDTRTAELEKLTENRQDSGARLQALYTQLNEVRRDAEQARKVRMAADEELATLSADLRRRKKMLDDDRLALATAERNLSAFDVESDLLSSRAAQIDESVTAAAATLSGRRTRLDTLEEQLATAIREASLAESDVDRRVRVLDDRKRALSDKRDALAAARAEARALEEIDRAFDSASPALSWVLAHQKELTGIVGPINDIVSAPQELEAVVERLLGGDLFGVVVADANAATRLVAEVADNSEGELAILPVLGARSVLERHPHVGSRLIDSLEYRPADATVVEALLGDVFLVDSIEEGLSALAKDPTGARFATSDGSVVWPNGKVTMGARVTDIEGVLMRKRRMNSLEDEVASHLGAVSDAELSLAAAEEALTAAQQDALEISQRTAVLRGEHDSLLEEVGRLEQSLTTLTREAESVASRRTDLTNRSEADRPQVTAIAERIEVATAEIAVLEEQVIVAGEVRDTRFREESEVASRLSTVQVEIATVSERETHFRSQTASIIGEIADLEETVKVSRESEKALELLRHRLTPMHELYAVLQERAGEWAEKLRDRASLEQADSETIRTQIGSAQEAVRAAQGVIDTRIEAAGAVSVEIAQVEVQVEAQVRRIVEDHGTSLETAIKVEPLDDRIAARSRADKLRRKISSIGPVNPVAAQEFDALKARREFMAEQIEDLEGSRKSLTRIVAAIDRKMKERFLETFEQVDASFQEIFAILFPGGQSQLQLTDPDNPEETGVEVVAQPRGKKLTKMMLMSGGEKSLTALALMFAVYKTRPVPFYILDEVEAALDDTNLRRFLAFVDSMRNKTQFIIVTHQRRTMEMADVLYGVSMQSDGVSKVVSQKLERSMLDETPEEALA